MDLGFWVVGLHNVEGLESTGGPHRTSDRKLRLGFGI